MPWTTSEIKAAIQKAHEDAGPPVTAFLQARNAALANHTGYVGAIKLWKAARKVNDAAREIVNSWIAYFTPNPNGAGWLAYLEPYRVNDLAVRVELDDSLNALLADLAAHMQIGVSEPAHAAPIGGGITRAPSPLKPATVTTKPDGTVVVSEGGETATVSPGGEVEVTRSPGIIALGLAAAAAIVYAGLRIVRVL